MKKMVGRASHMVSPAVTCETVRGCQSLLVDRGGPQPPGEREGSGDSTHLLTVAAYL